MTGPWGAGRNFSRREERRGAKVAVIGTTVADHLFGPADPVGRTVRIFNAPMHVIGVLSEKGRSGAGRDQDDIVFVPYRTALLRLGAARTRITPESVSFILAKTASDSVLPAARAGVEAVLDQRHRARPGAARGFRVLDPVAAMAAKRGSSQTIAWLLAVVAFVSLVVGGISIMNIMLVSVAERTREIGLRLAIGARRRDISRMFLSEAVLICLLGGAAGVAAGTATAWLIARLAHWPVLISPAVIGFALASTCLIGLFFGYFPARKAARLQPATALRYE